MTTPTITPETLAELKRLTGLVGPLPWLVDPENPARMYSLCGCCGTIAVCDQFGAGGSPELNYATAYIAAACNAAPGLVADVERLRAELQTSDALLKSELSLLRAECLRYQSLAKAADDAKGGATVLLSWNVAPDRPPEVFITATTRLTEDEIGAALALHVNAVADAAHADTIERLAAENERLRAALTPFAEWHAAAEAGPEADNELLYPWDMFPREVMAAYPTYGDCRRARAALEARPQ